MYTDIERDILEKSRRLQPANLSKFNDALYKLIENAQEVISYNSSYYFNGRWLDDPIDDCIKLKVVQSVGDYAVCRIILLSCHTELPEILNPNYDNYDKWEDEVPDEDLYEDMNQYDFTEVAQVWITPTGKAVQLLVDKSNDPDNYGYDGGFDLSSALLPAECVDNEIFESNIADWAKGDFLYSVVENIHRNPALDSLVNLLKNTGHHEEFAEMKRMFDDRAVALEWWGYNTLYSDFINKGEASAAARYYHEIKIAHRNGFNASESSRQTRWMELLDMITFCNGNIKDPHNYMPDKFDDTYQYWAERKRNKIEKMKKEEEYRDLVAAQMALVQNKNFCEVANARYLKEKKPFLAIRFDSETMDFHVLENVEEFCIEGAMQHNCLFSNKYYEMPDYIVMSCTDKKTKRRLSTITVDVKTGKIVANLNRGNTVPKNESGIRQVVIDHMPMFIKARQQQQLIDITDDAAAKARQESERRINARFADRNRQRVELGVDDFVEEVEVEAV